MISTLITIIVGGFIVYLVFFEGKLPKKSNTMKINNEKSKNGTGKKEELKSLLDAKKLLEFDTIKEIRRDEVRGVVVRNNGNEFVGMMGISGVNFNLLSAYEQQMLEENFAQLINGIDYSVQIYVQSRRLENEKYFTKYQGNLEKIKEKYEAALRKFEVLSSQECSQEVVEEMQNEIKRLSAQYDYGVQTLQYIIERCGGSQMIEKHYYIITSTTHNQTEYKEVLTDDEKLLNAYSVIENRFTALQSGLLASDIAGKILSPLEIADVIYRAYNKEDSEHYKLAKTPGNGYSHYFINGEKSKELLIKKLETEIDDEIELEGREAI